MRALLLAGILAVSSIAFAQPTNNLIFNQVYPISEPTAMGWKSSMVKSETILFEATPNVRFSFHNNIYERLTNGDNHGHAYYASFRPQIRMYTDNSVPVKMPSYRILVGTQHLWRLPNDNLFSVSLESGHFSNGQNGCTFDTLYADASRQSDSVIAKINSKTNLSNILNRKNGEFSTDLTELIFNYRIIDSMDGNYVPLRFLSLSAGATYYHDNFLFVLPFGGYADNLIPIYGHWRFMWSYEYTHELGKNSMSIGQYWEYIADAHPFVNPLRLETKLSYTLRKSNIGFFATYIYGHDNYNIRFVDSGNQFGVGVMWGTFPSFGIKA